MAMTHTCLWLQVDHSVDSYGPDYGRSESIIGHFTVALIQQ